MIEISKANSILNNLLLQYEVTSGGTTYTKYRYLGFSSTVPKIDEEAETSGGQKNPTYQKIINFTEPDDTTGYRRLKMSADNLSALTYAVNAETKNSDYNLSFPIPDKNQQYGQAVAIGFFDSDSKTLNPNPYYTAELKEPVTLGPKSTLVIYKDDFSVKLTSEKAADSSTG